ncbi:MAG: HAMP domain-containing protein, partial [Chloroflexota bacterium]|nr:HAMP domain-containing protein [Chloroflexota bacterium]
MTTNQALSRWSHFSRSTRWRVLLLLVILITSTVALLGYLSMRAVSRVSERMQIIGGERLDAQLTRSLQQVRSSEVQDAELMLNQAQQDVTELSFYAAHFLAAESGFEGHEYWDLEEQMFFGPEGQYINDVDDVSSVYLPNFVEVDEVVMGELRRTAYLDPLFVAINKSAPGVTAAFIGTEQNISRYYPNINLGSLLPPDFEMQQQPWYFAATPAENLARVVQWTAVYQDVAGKGLLVTASAPVYVNEDEFVGVVGIDLSLAQISEELMRGSSPDSYVLLVDALGQPIVLSTQGYQDVLGYVPAADELRLDLRTTETEFAPLLNAMVAGETGYATVQSSERELLVGYAPLENNTGWSLAHITESQSESIREMLRNELEEAVRNLMRSYVLPLAGGVLLFVLAVGSFAISRLTAPLEEVVAVVQEFERGNWDVPLPETGSGEINRLAQTLDTMRAYIQETMSTLEEHVAERTQQLTERTAQFQSVAELSQTLADRREMQDVLDAAVGFISERFEVYHVGIFLQDDTGTWMLLRAASSEGGRRLLIAGHRLKIGGQSVIGYVS